MNVAQLKDGLVFLSLCLFIAMASGCGTPKVQLEDAREPNSSPTEYLDAGEKALPETDLTRESPSELITEKTQSSCEDGQKRPCQQGSCTGTQECTSQGWGPCKGNQLQPESCDGQDNDCDGIIDNGLSHCVSTFAGSKQGYKNGFRKEALFTFPRGVTTDPAGNVYVAGFSLHLIRKIDPKGNVTTFAGSQPGDKDGKGAEAQFNGPWGIVADQHGNLYVSDFKTHRIRKIDPEGNVTTIAGSRQGYQDGKGKEAQFNEPTGLDVDADGNLYIADSRNQRIRKIDPSGNVTTLAGGQKGFKDGQGSNAQFYFPLDVVVNSQGEIYALDSFNNSVRKIDPSGNVTTLAGGTKGTQDGQGKSAQFHYPSGLALDKQGHIYVSDTSNHRIRKITPSGNVATIAGSSAGAKDGIGVAARFLYTMGITLSPKGILYVVDMRNHRIRRITP